MDAKDNEALGKLIFEVASGNAEALGAIYEQMGRVMTAVAAVYLADPFEVEETVEDALVLLVRKAGGFRENKNACAWINTIVTNLAKSRRRKNAKRREVPLEHASEKGTEWDEDGLLVREMLVFLSERERQAVILRYWYGMTLEEIARAMHRSKSGVKYLIGRAEQKLHDEFYGEGEQ